MKPLKGIFIFLLFTIALNGVNMLVDKPDTQIHKIQKGQEYKMFPNTYNPQSGSDGISLQGSSPLQVIQGSSPNLQPTITADQLNTAQLGTDVGSLFGGNNNDTTQQTYQQPAYVDPYAKWGGTAAYNALKAGFDTQKNNIYGSANDAATNLQGGYGQSILDTIKSFTRAQEGIDRKNVQNESSRIQGGRDIMSMIGRGVQSGGVRLAQGNAGSSSAAQAIANAYGMLGKDQMSKIGNQFAQNQDQIATDQRYQNEDLAAAPDKFKVQIEQNVNSIASAARDQFATLDAAMANASLPDRIAIEQEKETVRQQALSKLMQFDTQLRQGVGGIKAADRGQNIATANTQLSAGQADPNLFNYTTQAPVQVQNTGPSASTLPIFTYNSKNKQLA